MFITNIQSFPSNKVFQCKGLLANWLMSEKSMPLLGMTDDGKFCFSRTDVLEELLDKAPFWYLVGEKISR